MAISYGDAVHNFDLNLLHQSSENGQLQPQKQPQVKKQLSAVLLIKKKIAVSESLIKRFYKQRNDLERLENNLSLSKEECKQLCIKYSSTVNDIANMEQKMAQLRSVIEELNQEITSLKNNLNESNNANQATLCHNNQLQLLLNEKDDMIQALKIENSLNKNTNDDVGNLKNKVNTIQNENKEMLKFIKHIYTTIRKPKFTSKMSPNSLVLKFENFLKNKYIFQSENNDDFFDTNGDDNNNSDHDEILPNDCSLKTNNNSDSLLLEIEPIDVQVVRKKSEYGTDIIAEETLQNNEKMVEKSLDIICDLELSNDVAYSTDTGYGSYNDKCYVSPNGISDIVSPLSIDSGLLRNVPKQVDVSTSPIIFLDTEITSKVIVFNKSTSTNKSVKYVDKEINTIIDNQKIYTPTTVNKEQQTNYFTGDYLRTISVKYVNTGTNTIPIHKIITPVSLDQEKETNNLIDITDSTMESIGKASNPITSKNLTPVILNQQPRNIDDEDSNDFEINSIFNKMRMKFDVLTPIPPSPILSNEISISKQKTDNEYIAEEIKALRIDMQLMDKKIDGLCCGCKDKSCDDKLSKAPQSENQKKPQNIQLEDDTEIYINCKKSNNCESSSLKLSKQDKHAHLFLDTSECNNDSKARRHIDKNNSNKNSPILRSAKRIRYEDEDNIENMSDYGEYAQEIIDDCVDKTIGKTDLLEGNDKTIENDTSVIKLNQDTKSFEKRKNRKIVKNISKLQKIRNKLLPKGKIKAFAAPPKKLQLNNRLRQSSLNINILKNKNNTIHLNGKDVYERALQVVAELRKKEKSCRSFKSRVSLRPKKAIDMPEVKKNNICELNTAPGSISKKKSISSEKQEIVYNKQDSPSVYKQSNLVTRRQFKSDTPMLINDITKRNSLDKTTNFSPPRDIIQDTTIINEISQSETTRRLRSNSIRDSQEIKSNTLHLTKVRQKRVTLENNETINTRVLRSSTSPQKQLLSLGDYKKNNKTISNDLIKAATKDQAESKECGLLSIKISDSGERNNVSNLNREGTSVNKEPSLIEYDDIDIFTDNNNSLNLETESNNLNLTTTIISNNFEEGFFCKMIEKYGKKSIKKNPRTVNVKKANNILEELAEDIINITQLPDREITEAMDGLVRKLSTMDVKLFISSLTTFLMDPLRKDDAICRTYTPPAPPMSKSEQVLLYILIKLKTNWPAIDIINEVLQNIEYIIFRLNCTPEFEQVESLAHFYAVLCRYNKAKNRLRLFMLDAMYCISFKAIPLINQCLDVWMHVLPLAHLNTAKNPLVLGLVYLLHFYKCEKDYLNRVQRLRYILQKQYFYQMNEWNETKILEYFRNSLLELRGPIEMKMLRLSLIILAKRQGAKWCQKNIVNNILLPIIENKSTPNKVRGFSVSLLGPILRPYPNEMKLNCEVVINQLLKIMKESDDHKLQEAAFISLIYLSKNNLSQVIQSLLMWKPKNSVSIELENLVKDYIREKPLKTWINILTKINT